MRSTQCAIKAMNNIPLNVEKPVFLVESYLKQSFKTTQSDYSQIFRSPELVKPVIC